MRGDQFTVFSRFEQVKSVGAVTILNRGLHEVRPKRLHLGKLISTMVATVGGDDDRHYLLSSEPDETISFAPDLRQRRSLCLRATVSNALASLAEQSEDLLLTFVGSTESPIAPNPLCEQALFKIPQSFLEDFFQRVSMMAQATSASFATRRDLVIQEKPGRYSVLDMWQLSRKAAVKRARTALNEVQKGKPVRFPVAARGFGAGAIRLGQRRQGQVAVHITSTRLLAKEQTGLDFFERLAEILVRDHFRPDDNVFLSAPQPQDVLHANFAAEGLVGTSRAIQWRFPDLILGHLPVLSLIEAMTSPPACFIHLGDHPLIDIVEVRHA